MKTIKTLVVSVILLLALAGCPYDLDGHWEGTCEVSGPVEYVGTTVIMSYEFELDVDIQDDQEQLQGTADGWFTYIWADEDPIVGGVEFSVEGFRWGSTGIVEMTLHDANDENNENATTLRLDGILYADAIEGDCALSYAIPDWLVWVDLDGGDFLLQR